MIESSFLALITATSPFQCFLYVQHGESDLHALSHLIFKTYGVLTIIILIHLMRKTKL